METQNPMNPGYGRPALFPNQGAGVPPIIVNQQAPVAVVNPNMFKTTPVALTCPFCHKTMTTNVKQSCNCCSILLCWVTCLAFYVIVQCCRGKDLCCCDATHTCPHCGNVVGTYTSC